MDQVQRDQCRLPINLSEFQVYGLLRWERRKKRVRAPLQERKVLPLFLWHDSHLKVHSLQGELQGQVSSNPQEWDKSLARTLSLSFVVKEEYVNSLNSQAFQPYRKRIRGIQESWLSWEAELQLEPVLTRTALVSYLKWSLNQNTLTIFWWEIY